MKFNKNNLFILLLVGVLFVVLAIPTEKSQTETSYATDVEKRLEKILAQMQGVGTVHVMITCQEDDTVEGVAVIAEGGGNSVVKQNIIEVIQALFPVDSHKIKVIKAN